MDEWARSRADERRVWRREANARDSHWRIDLRRLVRLFVFAAVSQNLRLVVRGGRDMRLVSLAPLFGFRAFEVA